MGRFGTSSLNYLLIINVQRRLDGNVQAPLLKLFAHLGSSQLFSCDFDTELCKLSVRECGDITTDANVPSAVSTCWLLSCSSSSDAAQLRPLRIS